MMTMSLVGMEAIIATGWAIAGWAMTAGTRHISHFLQVASIDHPDRPDFSPCAPLSYRPVNRLCTEDTGVKTGSKKNPCRLQASDR